MITQPMEVHSPATWMVTLDANLTIRIVRGPEDGTAEMPFCNDLPVGVSLLAALGLSAKSADQLSAMLRSGRGVRAFRYTIEHKLLGRRHYSLSAAPYLTASGKVKLYHCSIADLTETLHLASRQQRHEAELSAIVDSSPIYLSVKDLEGRYLRLNAAARQIFAGWSRDPLGRTAAEMFPPELAADIEASDERVMETESTHEFEQQFIVAGQAITLLSMKFPIFDGDGSLIGVGSSGIDISQRKAMEHDLLHYANYDPLTELPNRRLCQKLLEDAVLLAQHSEGRVAVILADIDDFRALNNALGNSAGDEILVEVAWRLKASLDADCMVARLGGDDFCLVIPTVNNHADVDEIMATIHHIFQTPMTIVGREIFVGITMGAAAYPIDADGPEQLIQRADMALMSAKKDGDVSRRFSESMYRTAVARTQAASLLRRALEREELRLIYQPIVDAQTGACVMLEALMRWQSAELGAVSPATFIPLAEETGLIRPIGTWCLEQACRDAVEWNRERAQGIGVAVNVSPRQLFDEDFVAVVRRTLDKTGLSPALLKVEITESSMVRDLETCKAILESLAALGVTLALDDFGTGYSALSYLQQLKFHVLKLDQSFVRKIVPGETSAALTASIIAMASSLGMKTVAEGIETIQHRMILKAQGCTYLQGYHFSKPLPWKELACFQETAVAA